MVRRGQKIKWPPSYLRKQGKILASSNKKCAEEVAGLKKGEKRAKFIACLVRDLKKQFG